MYEWGPTMKLDDVDTFVRHQQRKLAETFDDALSQGNSDDIPPAAGEL